jgi:hypothetical protein
MTTCLLCPSPAVADGLCVDDGARLWAAQTRQLTLGMRVALSSLHASVLGDARIEALRAIVGVKDARAFLDRLEAAKAARGAAPFCLRGCRSHEDEEG